MEMEDQEYCSCGMEHGGAHRWTRRDRAVVARMEQHLDRSESLKVEIEELEYCLVGPEESDIDIRHITMNARGKKASQALSNFQWTGSK